MLKNILAVVAGYVVMFLFVMLTYTLAYLAMGAEGAFQPGTYDPSGMWIITMIVLGLLASILGGWVCAIIASSRRAPMILAGIVFVLGILFAIPTLSESDAPNVRSGDVSSMEAMESARQPAWVAFLNPVIGAVGVMIGAGLKKQKPEPLPTAQA